MTIKELIDRGYYSIYSNYRMYTWTKYLYDTSYDDSIVDLYNKYSSYSDCLSILESSLTIEEFKILERYWCNRASKNKRLRQRLTKMFQKNCIFLTLTFKDSVLDSCSYETRRIYVSRFLRSLQCQYVANIDFGVNDEFTHREHYHAVIQKDFIKINLWPYGISHIEKIRCDNCSSAKLSQYINKISNHAYKDSTKKLNSLIYSRG